MAYFRARPDIVVGLLFASLGGVIAWASTTYQLGSAAKMGPGFLPQLLGLLLLGLGVLISLGALFRGPMSDADDRQRNLKSILFACLAATLFLVTLAKFGKQGVTGLDFAMIALLVAMAFTGREAFWVSVGVGLFAVLLRNGGLLVSIVALSGCAALAEQTVRGREWVAITAGLALFCSLVFVYGLGLPLRLLPALPFVRLW